MRSASRQTHRWMLAIVALSVVVAPGSIHERAVANEPTDVRVVSITRGGDGTVAMVVAVPKPLVTGAGAPGAITVDAPNGASLTPSVTPLPPSATAVAVLLHTVGADVVTARRAAGARAEL